MHTPIRSSTTIKSGLGIFALGLVSVAVLTACGGGDAVTRSTTTTTTTATTFVTSASSNTPTVDLTPATTMRYMIQGAGTSVEGTSTFYTQAATSHALTAIGNNSLAPTNSTYAVQEYMGNATFAQGRWTKGRPTVNNVQVTPDLTGTDSRAVHYLVTQDLAPFTTNTTYKCGNADTSTGSATSSITSDTRSSGYTYGGGTAISDTMLLSAAVPYGATIATSAAGGATLTFDSNFGITVSGFSGPEVDYKGTTVTFSSSSDMPKYLNNVSPPTLYQNGEEGVAIVLGRDTAAGNIVLGISFRRALSNGARYQGMTSIICRS